MYLYQFYISAAFLLSGAALVSCCTCERQHLQQVFCRSHSVIKGSIISPSRSYHRDMFHINHTVRVMEVFKHPVNYPKLNENTTRITLYAENPMISTCGLWLEPRTKYVLAGQVSQDKQGLHLNLCSLHARWEDLTKQQKRGLRRRYGQNCHCKITAAACHECPTMPPDECLWNTSPDARPQCYHDYSVCRTTELDDSCHWMIPNDLRQCIKENT